ncbi:MAG: hypothetical protein P1U58_15740 [Verrucomicrobiales bacterium]|nr:hypothetical protein [Verrucomicrobiales bacterium]
MGAELNWVIASPSEAQVVIDAFDLNRVERKSRLFPVYESKDQSVRLVISGIGKVSAAAATAALASSSESFRSAVGWINFGIAGCSETRYGEAFLASKVTDAGNSRSWFPIPVWPKRVDLPRMNLTTAEKPLEEYSSLEGLVDMEAAGFYPIALRQCSVELAHVIKVVSDDPEHSIELLNKKKAQSLCFDAWDSIGDCLAAFREVLNVDSARLADPPGFTEWCREFHFTITSQHQLRRLLQEWQAISRGDSLPLPDNGNGKLALKFLREIIEEKRRSEIGG